jgi:hypothetical protein
LKVRFTNHAVRQIDQVLDYIAARSPQGEKAVRERMREVVTILEDHPYGGIGRAGAAFAAWRSRLTPTFSTIGLLMARLSLCVFATARGGPYDDLRLCARIRQRPELGSAARRPQGGQLSAYLSFARSLAP